ncbi:MAG: lytic transglycosylase domain-containing protein, partial [Pyrinomonadaceae bacterium]
NSKLSINIFAAGLAFASLVLSGAVASAQVLQKTRADIAATKDVNAGSGHVVTFTDGKTLVVDDMWTDEQGVWYRLGGVTTFVERSRIASNVNDKAKAKKNSNKIVAKIVETNAPQGIDDKKEQQQQLAVWIYMVGGARVEVDDVTETTEGAWYRRGPLSIFIERARIERIERETPESANASDGPKRARGWSTGNAHIDGLIKQNGARFGVDPYLIFCVMEQESHFNPRVVSPKGARGLMQLMPGTGARFGVRKPFDPAQNIMGGTVYLKQLLQNFGGRVDLVLASYNAGEGAVMKYGNQVPPYRETRDYVKRISKRYKQNEVAEAHTNANRR